MKELVLSWLRKSSTIMAAQTKPKTHQRILVATGNILRFLMIQ